MLNNMNNPIIYRMSRLGQTNEAMKVAYIAGKRIFILITKDYSIGIDIIRRESILPLIKGEYDQETKTYSPSNFIFAENDSFFEINTRLSMASIFLYSGKKFPENSVKAFVDAMQGYTSLEGTQVHRNILCESIVIILMTSMPADISQAANPYVEIINVPLIGENEFDQLVSEWLNKNEELPLEEDINGLKKIHDKDFLKGLYHNMRGLSPMEIITILRGLKVRHGQVYYNASDDRTNNEFEKMLSDIRKDAERIISKASALSLKDTTNAPSPAGLKNIDQWLKEYGDRVCHPENYEKEYAMQPPHGIIVSGVPGSGKSMMAKHIAKTLGRTLVRLDVGDAMGKYVGDTEKGFNDALRAVEELSPCVLWIDEMEKAFQGGHEVTVRMIGKFLTWMQEKSDRGLSIFVFCTSNDISKMPAEMFRSGRFDEKYSIFMPSANECGKIFESQVKYQYAQYLSLRESNIATRKLFNLSAINEKVFKEIINSAICIPHLQDVTDKSYTRENKFFTGADIASLIEKAKNIYINECGKNSGEYVFDSEKFIECLKKAIMATRTYGETNLEDIVKCFVQLNKNNFFSATTDVVVPFDGYDEIRYNSQRRKRGEGEKIEPELYSLANEPKFVKGKCEYDRQLYISVRNALNHLADKLIYQSY